MGYGLGHGAGSRLSGAYSDIFAKCNVSSACGLVSRAWCLGPGVSGLVGSAISRRPAHPGPEQREGFAVGRIEQRHQATRRLIIDLRLFGEGEKAPFTMVRPLPGGT